jgi:hypothetical protein
MSSTATTTTTTSTTEASLAALGVANAAAGGSSVAPRAARAAASTSLAAVAGPAGKCLICKKKGKHVCTICAKVFHKMSDHYEHCRNKHGGIAEGHLMGADAVGKSLRGAHVVANAVISNIAAFDRDESVAPAAVEADAVDSDDCGSQSSDTTVQSESRRVSKKRRRAVSGATVGANSSAKKSGVGVVNHAEIESAALSDISLQNAVFETVESRRAKFAAAQAALSAPASPAAVAAGAAVIAASAAPAREGGQRGGSNKLLAHACTVVVTTKKSEQPRQMTLQLRDQPVADSAVGLSLSMPAAGFRNEEARGAASVQPASEEAAPQVKEILKEVRTYTCRLCRKTFVGATNVERHFVSIARDASNARLSVSHKRLLEIATQSQLTEEAMKAEIVEFLEKFHMQESRRSSDLVAVSVANMKRSNHRQRRVFWIADVVMFLCCNIPKSVTELAAYRQAFEVRGTASLRSSVTLNRLCSLLSRYVALEISSALRATNPDWVLPPAYRGDSHYTASAVVNYTADEWDYRGTKVLGVTMHWVNEAFQMCEQFVCLQDTYSFPKQGGVLSAIMKW